MGIVGGLDLHRSQTTFDWVDQDTGQVERGRFGPSTREVFAGWLEGLPSGEGAFAVEATTGWRFVVEELVSAGFDAYVAEPADTAALKGAKRRAKTDGLDAKFLRELLQVGWLPESWIPPGHMLDLRETVRLRARLAQDRTEWIQRIHALLFHHGLPKPTGGLLTRDNRKWLQTVAVPGAARQCIDVALRQIGALESELEPIDRWLGAYCRRQPGCKHLRERHYGFGYITAPTVIAELGDVRRFANREAVVRYTGLDVTVYSSDGKRAAGKLSRQGPALLRWALFEAATCHARVGAPHHDTYQQVKKRLDGTRAGLTVARKLVREIRHTLSALGDDALAEVVDLPLLPAA